MTLIYEEALNPAGLRATQFTMLQALSLAGEVTQARLGQILAMDSTTLTRTLAIMNRRGWIAKRRGEDRREWRMRLSEAGEVQFRQALPYWEKAQAELRRQLGDDLSGSLMKLTQKITNKLTD
jgi:DNA-binding MarR family transcriptional regulator